MRALVSIVTVAGLVSLGACGGKSKSSSTEGMMKSEKNPAATLIDPTLCETEGKRVMNFDLNRDERPDIWKLYQTVDEGGTKVEVQTCKQVDFNHDGRVDYAAGYSRKGSTISERFDFDFDGKFDAFYQYNEKTGNLFEVQRESGFDGKYDVQEVFTEEGKLSTVRYDRNGDGNPDLWEQYNEQEQLVAILYDEDFDNRVDRREKAPAPTAPKPPPPSDQTGEEGEEGEDTEGADGEAGEGGEGSEGSEGAKEQGGAKAPAASGSTKTDAKNKKARNK